MVEERQKTQKRINEKIRRELENKYDDKRTKNMPEVERKIAHRSGEKKRHWAQMDQNANATRTSRKISIAGKKRSFKN